MRCQVQTPSLTCQTGVRPPGLLSKPSMGDTGPSREGLKLLSQIAETRAFHEDFFHQGSLRITGKAGGVATRQDKDVNGRIQCFQIPDQLKAALLSGQSQIKDSALGLVSCRGFKGSYRIALFEGLKAFLAEQHSPEKKLIRIIVYN